MTRLLAVTVGLACLSPAAAHDLWLIPPAKAETGKPVSIRANSGMDFPKSEHAPDTARLL